MRPRLRGVSHRLAFVVSLATGTCVVASAHDLSVRIASAIYALLLAGMFGTSALLHAADWRGRTRDWLRRADHAMIFAFIAGTYTPLCVAGVGGSAGTRLLVLAWSAAGLGILRALLWPHAPRAVTTPLYLLVGWVMVAYLPEVRAAMDPFAFAFVLAGGIVYSVGAAVYALRFPDPWPTVFGYHEVFHAMIIAGSACHFVAVARVVG
jgi:hemolysin III